MIYKNLIRPLLFQMDPEKAHDRIHTIGKSLARSKSVINVCNWAFNHKSSRLTQVIHGITFMNPVGLAAGFDKNAHLSSLLHALGFGFTEIGSITANPSTGNTKPRMFRLPAESGLINRMGLNNDGAQKIIDRISKSGHPSIPLGINIAKTHDPSILGKKAIEDYITSFVLAQKVADYITINISCPNTEEGKTFEDPDSLHDLLTRIQEVRRVENFIPVYVKLSADLSDVELQTLVAVCEENNIDGYIATNTSSKRENLTPDSQVLSDVIGKGGLSGTPIYSKALKTVTTLAKITDGKKPIIAVGGIDSTEKAIEMIQHGAWLLQLYSGLIYEGPLLPYRINRGLDRYLQQHKIEQISQLRGSKL